MHFNSLIGAVGLAVLSGQAYAQSSGIAKPDMVLQQVIEGLPKDDRQTIRVMTASFKPGDKTVHHTHRFPVTVYVLEGAFTLDLDGRPPLTVKAGEAMVEPPNVAMTGYNRSSETTKVVIFYVSANDTPFLDLTGH